MLHFLKLLLIGLFGALGAVLVVGLVLGLAPFGLVYFCFARFCSAIEEFKPEPASRKRKATRPKRVKVPSQLLNLIPLFRAKNHDNAGQYPTTDPALPGK